MANFEFTFTAGVDTSVMRQQILNAYKEAQVDINGQKLTISNITIDSTNALNSFKAQINKIGLSNGIKININTQAFQDAQAEILRLQSLLSSTNLKSITQMFQKNNGAIDATFASLIKDIQLSKEEMASLTAQSKELFAQYGEKKYQGNDLALKQYQQEYIVNQKLYQVMQNQIASLKQIQSINGWSDDLASLSESYRLMLSIENIQARLANTKYSSVFNLNTDNISALDISTIQEKYNSLANGLTAQIRGQESILRDELNKLLDTWVNGTEQINSNPIVPKVETEQTTQSLEELETHLDKLKRLLKQYQDEYVVAMGRVNDNDSFGNDALLKAEENIKRVTYAIQQTESEIANLKISFHDFSGFSTTDLTSKLDESQKKVRLLTNEIAVLDAAKVDITGLTDGEILARIVEVQTAMSNMLSGGGARLAQSSEFKNLLLQFRTLYEYAQGKGLDLSQTGISETALNARLQAAQKLPQYNEETYNSLVKQRNEEQAIVAKLQEELNLRSAVSTEAKNTIKSSDATTQDVGSLKEKLAIINEISAAYQRQISIEDQMNETDDGTRKFEKLEAELDLVEEKIRDFEAAYTRAIVTMQDGSKIDIPLDEEFAETTNNILKNASQIASIDLISPEVQSAINGYEALNKILARNIALKGSISGNIQPGDLLTHTRTYNQFGSCYEEVQLLQRAIENIRAYDANGLFGDLSQLEKAENLLQRLGVRLRELAQEKSAASMQEMTTDVSEVSSDNQTPAIQGETAAIKEQTQAVENLIAVEQEESQIDNVTDNTPVIQGETAAINEQTKAVQNLIAVEQAESQADNVAVEASAITQEAQAFDTVRQAVVELTTAIDTKTNAITQEKLAMDVAAQSEVASLQAVQNEVSELDVKIRALAPLKFEIAGIDQLNNLRNLDTSKLQISDKSINNLTSLTYVLETLKAVLGDSSVSEKLTELKTALTGLNLSELNRLNLPKDAFSALSTLQTEDINNLVLLARVLKDLNQLAAIDANLLTGLKITKAQASNIELAATGILNLKNSLTGLEAVTTSIHAIDTLITKIATLKGVVDSVKDIKVEIVENTTTGQKETSVKEGTPSSGAKVSDAERLLSTYTKLEATLKKINALQVKQTLGTATHEEQLRLNDLLETEKKLRADIISYQSKEISNQTAEVHLQELENSLAEDLLNKTGGSAFNITKQQQNAYSKASAINAGNYINAEEIMQAQSVLKSYYAEMESDTKRSSSANEELKQKFEQQLGILKELVNTSNLLTKSNGAERWGAITAGTGNLAQRKNEVLSYVNALGRGKFEFQGWTTGQKEMIVTTRTADNQLQTYRLSLDQTTGAIHALKTGEKEYVSAGGRFLANIKKKFGGLLQYFTGITLIYRIWMEIRQGITMVKDLDTALTEMRKVSDETVASLERFQKESFKIAESVGATAKTIQNSTADWMRLGESIEEAKKSAEVSSILFNVSEFENIDEATESLVSMSQAFKDLDKIDIVDKLNNVGNNFAISTDGLATALQNSASSLKTAQNDIDEAIALTTAANAVVQDPDKVGAGLRTIALRITGTDAARKELEELGEDVDDFTVTTSSKLNKQVMDLTKTTDKAGVSLLDMNGNYRSTYEILQDIADIWEQIAEEDLATGENRQNALLEMLAGKNRSNILASILESPEILRNAFESSQNSEGSAKEELDKYLDSINGKMEQLTNNVQEFWHAFLDSDMMKKIIDFLSGIVKFGTDLIDTFGTFPTVIGIAFGLLSRSGGGRAKISLLSQNMPPNRLAVRCASSGVYWNVNICFLYNNI